MDTKKMSASVFEKAYKALCCEQPVEKVALTTKLYHDFSAGLLSHTDVYDEAVKLTPGRPEKPLLVELRELSKRSLSHEKGRAALVHAITHIEFNAINLALDAVYRFRNMPPDFYKDWLQVAFEEAKHFTLLNSRLIDMGYHYGSFKAHNGLWEMAMKTAHDPMLRMGLVPRVLEARGLDVTPAMIKKLSAAGDQETADCLVIILKEEVGHVKIGTRWFLYCCELNNVEPQETFLQLMCDYGHCHLRPPVNIDARLEAGFSEYELEQLVI